MTKKTDVKILKSISGLNFSYKPGAVVPIDIKSAKKLVAAGLAEKVTKTKAQKKLQKKEQSKEKETFLSKFKKKK